MKNILLLILLVLLCSCAPNDNEIVSVDFKDASNHKLRAIVVCMEKPTTSISLAKVVLETKDGLTLSSSNVLIGGRGGKETCFPKNIYSNLLPKKKQGDLTKRLSKSVVTGNIRKIEVYMSDNHGWNYKKKNQFTQFIRKY